jgi:hypothetical protein
MACIMAPIGTILARALESGRTEQHKSKTQPSTPLQTFDLHTLEHLPGMNMKLEIHLSSTTPLHPSTIHSNRSKLTTRLRLRTLRFGSHHSGCYTIMRLADDPCIASLVIAHRPLVPSPSADCHGGSEV